MYLISLQIYKIFNYKKTDIHYIPKYIDTVDKSIKNHKLHENKLNSTNQKCKTNRITPVIKRVLGGWGFYLKMAQSITNLL